MTMEVTVLGSGTAIPRAGRGSPGYLVSAGAGPVLLDCGFGALRCAAAAGATPSDIQTVLLTHFHPDHNIDLIALLFANNSWIYDGRGKLTVFAPAGFREILDHWFSGPQGQWLKPKDYELELVEIGPGEHRIAGLEVEAIHVEHTPQSLAYRIAEVQGGPVFAYSGDSGPCEALVQVARGADLFLCECAVPDSNAYPGHLSPSALAEVVREAKPRRLVVTHLYPEMEEEPIEEVIAGRWTGPVERAADGRTYRIGENA